MKHILTSLFAIITISLLLFSCQTSTNKLNENSGAASINGAWESIGSGLILHIQDSTAYAFYDITPISCLAGRKGQLHDISKSLTLRADTLLLAQGVMFYQFTRTKNLPELCTIVLDEETATDPLFNFDVFAETVKEHYAFLELNEIDWEELYKQQKGKLTKNSSSAELYLVIEETLELLNDNHAYLEANDEVYDAIDDLLGEEEVEESDLPELGDLPTAKKVFDHHVQLDLTKDSWLIRWGLITDDVGYIMIKTMWLYADLDMSEQLIDSLGYVDAFGSTKKGMYEGEYIQKEVEGCSNLMDRVMKDLINTESLIVDIRFNGGGQDAVSFEVLNRFTSDSLKIAAQKFRYGTQFTNDIPLFISGVNKPYNKPVYLLTSPQSGSAAETLAIGSMAIDNIKRIGSSTEGAMSTTLDKTLPIGWDFCISNEIYMDNRGKNYENIGIPPDYEISYSRDRQTFFRNVTNDLAKDKRDILSSIEALNSNR